MSIGVAAGALGLVASEPKGWGFRVWGLGFRVSGLGFGI